MNRNTSIIVGLTLSLGLLLSCGSKPNPELEEAYQKAAAAFVADESFYPILDEELFYFNSQRLDTIDVEYINEQDAVKRLMKLETWLAFTTRQFTAKELKKLTVAKIPTQGNTYCLRRIGHHC